MNKLKSYLKKVPILYPLWHRMRLRANEQNERKKAKAYKKHGMEVLADISDVAIQNNYKLICAWGTLLGIIRDNKLIPWDNDLDFIILDDGDFLWDDFGYKLKEKGFWLYREIYENEKIVEKSYKKKEVLCDIRVWDFYNKRRTVEGDYFRIKGVSYIENRYCEYEATLLDVMPITNVEKITFNGIDVLIPENSEELLRAGYGPMWEVPDAGWKSKAKRIRGIMRKEIYYKKPFITR